MLSPLKLKSLLPPLWTSFVPFAGLKGEVVRWRASRELRQRVSEDVEHSWEHWPHLSKLREHVGAILADSCRWPNTSFLPDDECAVLFLDDIEMSDAIAVTRIAEQFVCDSKEVSELLSTRFVDLLEYLYGIQNATLCRDSDVTGD